MRNELINKLNNIMGVVLLNNNTTTNKLKNNYFDLIDYNFQTKHTLLFILDVLKYIKTSFSSYKSTIIISIIEDIDYLLNYYKNNWWKEEVK